MARTFAEPSAPPKRAGGGQPQSGRDTTLHRNLDRLRRELSREPRSPRIFVVGLGGCGKSSLVDALAERSTVPRPVIGVVTDATDWSRSLEVPLVMRWDDVLVVDVPGYATGQHPTQVLAKNLPANEADVVLFLIAGKVLQDDARMLRSLLARAPGRVWVVRSKVDHEYDCTPEELVDAVRQGLPECVGLTVCPVSVAKGHGLAELRSAVMGVVASARANRAARAAA